LLRGLLSQYIDPFLTRYQIRRVSATFLSVQLVLEETRLVLLVAKRRQDSALLVEQALIEGVSATRTEYHSQYIQSTSCTGLLDK
jgi:hypothetical protein